MRGLFDFAEGLVIGMLAVSLLRWGVDALLGWGW